MYVTHEESGFKFLPLDARTVLGLFLGDVLPMTATMTKGQLSTRIKIIKYAKSTADWDKTVAHLVSKQGGLAEPDWSGLKRYRGDLGSACINMIKATFDHYKITYIAALTFLQEQKSEVSES